MTWALEVADLQAGYPQAVVVHDLSLRVGVGEIVALTGLNGAGKTTTLLTLAGILPALGGTVSLFGTRVTRRPAHLRARSGLVLVPESRAICPQLSTLENLRLIRPNSSGMAIRDVLDLLPVLSPLLRRRAGLLSGGEQQTLALAKAFVAGPRVLMIDELSLGLAPVIVGEILPLVRSLAAKSGVAVLLVEQHSHIAAAVADRAYLLDRGRIVAECAASELTSRRDLADVGRTASGEATK